MIAHSSANAALEDYCWEMCTLLGTLEARWRQQAREAGDADGVARARSAFVAEHRAATRVALDELFGRMSGLLQDLSPEARRPAHELYRQVVQPFFLHSSFCRRALDKPLGYPGDYRMVETIFRGSEVSTTPMGKLLGEYALQCGPSEAHRGRLPWAVAQLDAVARRRPRPSVLSFACGPEVVLRRWVGTGAVADITLADHDPTALAWAHRHLEKARPAGNDSLVRPVVANAFDFHPGSGAMTRLGLTAPVDAVMVLGLLDYLDDEATVSLIAALGEVLRPGGVLLLSNLHSPNRWRALMELTADWSVIHRTVPAFEGLVRAAGGYDQVTTTLHESGTNLYCSARRALTL